MGNTVVYHSADGAITYTKSGIDLVMTGSGSLTTKNFRSDQFGIRLLDEASNGAATHTEFLKIDHSIHIGNNRPIGRPQKLIELSNVRPLYFFPELWTRE